MRAENVEKAANKKPRHMSVRDGFIIYTPLIVFGLLCLFPFWVLIAGSFTTSEGLREGVSLIPKQFSLNAYKMLVLDMEQILSSYLTSVFVTVAGMAVNVVLLLLVAYPLSDTEFKWRRAGSFFVYFSMIFSIGMVPVYIVINRIFHLANTYAILIIYPAVAPGHVFLLRVFLQGVPNELMESARLDGAGEYRILFKIVVPIIMPGIATIAFQSMLMYWNDAFTSLWFASSKIPIARYILLWEQYIRFLKDVSMGLVPGLDLGGVEVPELPVRYAMVVVSALPMLVMFSFFQRYFVGGMTAGAVKG